MIKHIFIALLCMTCIAIACDYSSSDEDNTEEIDSSKSPSVRTKCARNPFGETTNQKCMTPKRRRRVRPQRTRSIRQRLPEIRRRINYERNVNNFTTETANQTANEPVAQACCLDLIVNPHGTTERIVMSPNSSTYPEDINSVNPPSATESSNSTSRLVDMLSHLCSISTFTSPAGIPDFALNSGQNSYSETANETLIPLGSYENSLSIDAQFFSNIQREFHTESTAPVVSAEASTSLTSLMQADVQPSGSGSAVRTCTACPIERNLTPETVSDVGNAVQHVLSEMGYTGHWKAPIQHGTLSSIREVSASNQMNGTSSSDSDGDNMNYYRVLLDRIRSNADYMLSSESLSDWYNLIGAELESIDPADNPTVLYTEVLVESQRQVRIIAQEIRELAKQMLEEYKYSLQKLRKMFSKIKKLKDLGGGLKYSFNSLSAFVNKFGCVGSFYYVRITKTLLQKYIDDCRELANMLEYLKSFSNKHVFKF